MGGYDFYYEAEAEDAVAASFEKLLKFARGGGMNILQTSADPHSLVLLAIKQFFQNRKRSVKARAARDKNWWMCERSEDVLDAHEGYESYNLEQGLRMADKKFYKALLDSDNTISDIKEAFDLKSNYAFYKKREKVLKRVMALANTEVR